jgi:site-specific DNA recombinase
MSTYGETTATVKAALYIRVSTEEQADRFGPSLQKEALLNLIKSKGKLPNGSEAMVLAGEEYIYLDDGISGTTIPDERPGFSQLKEDIANAPEGSRPFDIVLVFKIDRFARKLKILLEVIEFFEKHEIRFASAHESIDTSTPFGKAMLNIIGVIAELELENIKLRTQAGREEAAKLGKAMGSTAPFGFKKDSMGMLERFEPEADIVVRIFDVFVNERRSAEYIAKLLTKEKVLSPMASAAFHAKRKYSKKKTPNEFWRAEKVMDILRDERYIGMNYYNRWFKKGMPRPKEEWKLSQHALPQIIDILTFNKAQKLLLALKHEGRNSHSERLYLLSGLLRCDACRKGQDDYTYWSGSRKKLDENHFTYYYQCGKKNPTKTTDYCYTLPLPGEEVEKYVLQKCLQIVSNPQGVFEYQQKLASTGFERKHLQKRESYLLSVIHSIPGQKELLREQHQAGVIDLPKLKQEFAGVDDKEKNAKKELIEVQEKLSKQSLSDNYKKGLELFVKSYEGGLEDIRKDREKAYKFLHALIDSIIVYSRPITSSDKIAGKKKIGVQQLMPNGIQIKLRLPQEFLNQKIILGGFAGSGQNTHHRADGRN